ncbi:hypothetical protein M5J15_07000 [Serratia symbiotica]|uniref:aldose epimerase family protein n=1 Tax=Serratia symbiotica TaxID=138074 RepID=UPI00209148A8|nr:hypothetical protein [Serratia symbiotica]USS96775.1 hypothetical protein M5J15_07000 [Serratia symbiotica]
MCFPWFGSFTKPNHGLTRTLPWECTSHSEDERGVELVFTLRDTAETRASWPHKFTLWHVLNSVKRVMSSWRPKGITK